MGVTRKEAFEIFRSTNGLMASTGKVFVKELCKSPLNPISSHIWTQATLTSIQWIKTEPHQMTCPDGTNISRMHQATWHLTRVFRSLHSSHTTLLIYLPCVGRLLKTIQQLLFTLTSLYLLLYKYFNHWAIFFCETKRHYPLLSANFTFFKYL